MDHLTASVGAVLGTSALLYFITAPRQRDDEELRLTPWEEHSTIARTRHIRDKFQNKQKHRRRPVERKSSMEYTGFASYRRKNSSLSEEEFEGSGSASDGSVTSDRSS
ncbi:hypothetical protein IV203_032903 [Nitzschia inconspicua]|uniref:Uncharacterized protein n=1 Tax=Nitzschia inconspicua TaxID=303405 RepID=A0A9K3PF85_9STRA|nr:hypothetical protein IV203_032903 [Nitzschia inconspicua]